MKGSATILDALQRSEQLVVNSAKGTIAHHQHMVPRPGNAGDRRNDVLHGAADRIRDLYGLRHPGREPLRIGTFVNANIEGRELHDVVVLPRYVLRAGEYLWVVDENMRLRNRKVSTLRAGGDKVYIKAGLDAGELVSLTNLNASFAGAEVEIQSRARSDNLGDPVDNSLELPPKSEATATAAVPQASSVAGGQ